MSVKIEHITKRYDSQLALNDVSFEVGRGEVVGLLGPNGAGKSTLMKIISCFIPPTSGKVSVEGFDVIENPMEVRRRVGYLPEHNPLYIDMYVREYLEFVAGVHGLRGRSAKSRIDDMIEVTGLTPEVHKRIAALSKGYRQRVGLAQAMMHNPSVLILDEPTSGLDPNQLVDIRNLIKRLGNEKTVLFSTHIMQEVEAVCQRVVIINNGLVVADDETGNIKQNVGRNVLVVEFEQKLPQDFMSRIPALRSARPVGGNRWILEPQGDNDIRPQLMRWAVDNNIVIKDMRREEISMEEAFQKLTRG